MLKAGQAYVYSTTEKTFYDEYRASGSPSLLVITGSTSGETMTNITSVDAQHVDSMALDGVGGSCDNVTITNNVMDRIVDNGGFSFGSSNGQVLKVTDRITGLTIENNHFNGRVPHIFNNITIDNYNNNTAIGSWGMRIKHDEGPVIITNMYNNIIEKLGTEDEGDGLGVTFTNHGNNIFGVIVTAASFPYDINDTESEIGNAAVVALVTDASTGDLTLAEDSLAINFGNAIYSPVTDIEGVSRDAFPDAGAYEYVPGQNDPIFEPIIPNKIEMKCYNNVFNPLKGKEAIIQVELDKQAFVSIVIYDGNGKEIKKILNEERQPGLYTLNWDGKDAGGSIVGSGIYMVHMKAGGYAGTEKIAVVK